MSSSVALHDGDSGTRMSSETGERLSDVADAATSRKGSCLDNPVIAEHLEAIRALCREYGVSRLEVFGSVCTPDFDPNRSDVDFLVEYPPDYDFGPWAARYLALQEALANLLGRNVDLVMIRAVRRKYFLQSVNQTRQLLYAA
jgi:predicted nucleotidyltransferase